MHPQELKEFLGTDDLAWWKRRRCSNEVQEFDKKQVRYKFCECMAISMTYADCSRVHDVSSCQRSLPETA